MTTASGAGTLALEAVRVRALRERLGLGGILVPVVEAHATAGLALLAAPVRRVWGGPGDA